MKLPQKHIILSGSYLGSHPKLPKPSEHIALLFSKRAIEQKRPFHRNKTLFKWKDIKGFDYTGEVMNGVYTATLSTTTGDLVLETASFHASSASGNQMYADRRRRKLNAIKRLAIEQTSNARRI